VARGCNVLLRIKLTGYQPELNLYRKDTSCRTGLHVLYNYKNPTKCTVQKILQMYSPQRYLTRKCKYQYPKTHGRKFLTSGLILLFVYKYPCFLLFLFLFWD